MARTLITAPKSARRGDIIEIRVLIQHPMETGYRPGADGKVLPRDLIRRFGRSSFVFGQGLFSEDVCVATSEAVMVYVDGREQKALPVPAEVVAAMAPYVESPPAA